MLHWKFKAISFTVWNFDTNVTIIRNGQSNLYIVACSYTPLVYKFFKSDIQTYLTWYKTWIKDENVGIRLKSCIGIRLYVEQFLFKHNCI
jgi:hypothetical protein